MLAKRKSELGGTRVKYFVVMTLLIIGVVGSIYYWRYQGENARIANESSEQISSNQDEVVTEDENKDVTSGSENANDDDEQSVIVEGGIDLPQTGMSDFVPTMLGLFVISVTISYYIQSKRRLGYYL